MVRRLLAAAAVMVVMPLAAMLAPGAVSAATAATCTGGVAVTSFAFNPPDVPSGSSSDLTLVLRNCTSQAIEGSTAWFGIYAGGACPVLDPFLRPYTLAPGGTYTRTESYGDSGFPDCHATALTITANVDVNGAGTVTSVSAALRFTQPVTSGCHVRYAPNLGRGMFSASVTVVNAGSSPIDGWTVTFSFAGDEKITRAWNASVTQAGASVTATSVRDDKAIAPGGSQSFSLEGTWAASDAPPASFTVNCITCT
jgi:hypothetical protein